MRWPLAPVGSMVQLENGYPFSSTLFTSEGRVPLVRIRDLAATEFETFLQGQVPERVLLQDGDVVVGMDGEFNVVRWHRGPAALNQRLCRLRGAGGADVRYVEYALPTALKWIYDTQFATTVKHLSSSEILTARIPSPEFEEQRQIADFLDDQVARINKIIAARREQIAALDKALSAELTALFLSGDRVPMRRMVREAAVGIVVQPAKYYVSTLDGVPALRGLNVSEGRISTDHLIRISDAGHRENLRSRLTSGDVVVVRTGDAGAACVVPNWAVGWNCIDLVIVRPNVNVLPAYLAHTLNAARRDTGIAAAASGSIQQHFGVAALLGLPVRWVDSEAQRVLSMTADAAYAWARQGSAQLRGSVVLLSELKRSLITAAVTGEFDVSSADGSRVPV